MLGLWVIEYFLFDFVDFDLIIKFLYLYMI